MKNNRLLHNLSNYIITAFALFILIYLSLAYLANFSMGLVYNSDIISIPYLYNDLFLHGGKLAYWSFPPTMCFFPDALAYFIIRFITQKSMLSVMLFPVYQLLFYFILIVWVGKKTIPNNRTFYLLCISVFLTFFLYSAGYLQQNIFYAGAPSGHFGAALMFLLGLILIIGSFSGKTRLPFVFLFVICLLTVFSDMLYITQFIATAIASLIVLGLLSEKPKRKIYQINIAVTAISTIIAYILLHNSKLFFGLHIGHDHYLIKRYHFHDLFLAVKMIYTDLEVFYRTDAVVLLSVFIFFFVSFVYLVKLFFRNFRGEKLQENDLPFVFTIIMLFMSILSGFFSLIFLDNNLMSGDSSLRHFQTFILFPVFLGLPLYLARFTNITESIARYYKSITLALLFCAFIFSPARSISNLFDYYPPQISCMDQLAKTYHLKNGVAQYWYAKLFSFLSRENLNLATIQPYKGHMVPSKGYVSLNEILNKSFNFVVIDNVPGSPITAESVVSTWGKPLKILTCPNPQQNPMTIYLYKNGVINSTWTQKELQP